MPSEGDMKVDLIVLNYNGEKLLPQCLPSIIEAKECSKFEVFLLVLDNESRDDSLRVLERFGDRIKVIRHKNRFLCSLNDVVQELDSDIVIFLNNDIKVERNFIDPLVNVFLEHSDAFLVAPKVLTFDNAEAGAFTVAKVKFGLFWSSALFKNWSHYSNNLTYTFSAGFGAFDRKKFLQLGGYDELYLPGRFEDADIGLRAWRMGWKCYYQPESIVYHIGQVAFREKFGSKGIDLLDARNKFLFIWKNYDLSLLIRHLFYLPLWFLLWIARGEFYYLRGFIQALRKIGKVRYRRMEEKNSGYKIGLNSIFSYFSQWA